MANGIKSTGTGLGLRPPKTMPGVGRLNNRPKMAKRKQAIAEAVKSK